MRELPTVLATILSNQGWTANDLARAAGISWSAANNAIQGNPVQARIARDVLKAVNTAFNKEYTIHDLEINIQGMV